MTKHDTSKQCPSCGGALMGWSDILVCSSCGWTSERVRKPAAHHRTPDGEERRLRQQLCRANRGIKRFSL